jgi:transketolase
VGDGELQEGQVWEGVQFMAHHNVNNAILIVDNNKRQLDGYTEEVCRQFDLTKKFEAFGLNTVRADGHDVISVYNALTSAKNSGKPSAVILDTEKGHG